MARSQADDQGLGTLLDNYVNFSRFYSRKGGVFQAGTLYLDGRGCNLVFEVTDAAKHGSMAPMAGAYLAYGDCVRAGGEKKTIATAFTAGDVDNLFVGRNGVFVDRKGRDWQATITKVIVAPISIRQAFWAPYKKMVRAIEERVAKHAAAAEAESQAKLDATATKVAEADKLAGVAPAAGATPPEAKKGIDIGTVAALGVAVGGIAAVLTAVMAGVFGLGRWMPIGLAAIMLAISTPSMVLAFIKLRRRNLGPLLDANGWAINALTRINVPFGTALNLTGAMSDQPLPPGEIVDGIFEIIRQLGAGAMGDVYEAYDQRLGRRIALKISKDGAGEFLIDEARTLAALRHPAIIHVFHRGTHRAREYVSMELIDDVTLLDLHRTTYRRCSRSSSGRTRSWFTSREQRHVLRRDSVRARGTYPGGGRVPVRLRRRR